MNYKVKNMIYEREIKSGNAYEYYEVKAAQSFESPYMAEEYKTFISPEAAKANKLKGKIVDEPLCNNANSIKRAIKIGLDGLYVLEIRVGFRLKELMVQPTDVIIDIYFGNDDTLIYTFYNLSEQNVIEVIARIVEDDEGIAQKLRTDPKDLVWRKYFIKRAQNMDTPNVKPKKAAEKTEHEILTAQEASDYLRISKKTLQNYVSQGKVKSLRSGKFRKKDLDSYLESKKDSRKKIKK